MQAAGDVWSLLSLMVFCYLAQGTKRVVPLPHLHSERVGEFRSSPHNPEHYHHRHGRMGQQTHSAASDSCSLVRFRGWLSVVMLWAWRAGPGGRWARRSALLALLTKATMACQPLLLNQIWVE